ncbi:DUF1178 family protein [Profundibacterium mesophilum]|uniref:DUF1178 family protein n=1 Tax=Profundibacterium mesophilum KAUST100406-0324 TaxID=1037889 RepID=A0A921NWL6_9RHOB|nr:DUF1178 family protein [Profundibacterium mesophilum]KAF0677013.1 uncharacterized protein PMES_00810 [Profundibacterium mesophilum KAUST100406-0324]
MIRYTLRCERDHRFESWFQSAQAYDALVEAGKISCPECASIRIGKALMAPPVTSGKPRGALPPAVDHGAAQAPAKGATPEDRGASGERRAAAIAELRRLVEANSTDVGKGFAKEARAIHEGRAEARAIHGEAAPSEARALIEEGVPLLPLPFKPRRKMN